jgi:hypothetical protein
MATDSPVISVEQGCPNAPVGCACTGRCHELIDVVPAADYWRVVGERDEARRRANGCGHDQRTAGPDW